MAVAGILYVDVAVKGTAVDGHGRIAAGAVDCLARAGEGTAFNDDRTTDVVADTGITGILRRDVDTTSASGILDGEHMITVPVIAHAEVQASTAFHIDPVAVQVEGHRSHLGVDLLLLINVSNQLDGAAVASRLDGLVEGRIVANQFVAGIIGCESLDRLDRVDTVCIRRTEGLTVSSEERVERSHTISVGQLELCAVLDRDGGRSRGIALVGTLGHDLVGNDGRVVLNAEVGRIVDAQIAGHSDDGVPNDGAASRVVVDLRLGGTPPRRGVAAVVSLYSDARAVDGHIINDQRAVVLHDHVEGSQLGGVIGHVDLAVDQRDLVALLKVKRLVHCAGGTHGALDRVSVAVKVDGQTGTGEPVRSDEESRARAIAQQRDRIAILRRRDRVRQGLVALTVDLGHRNKLTIDPDRRFVSLAFVIRGRAPYSVLRGIFHLGQVSRSAIGAGWIVIDRPVIDILTRRSIRPDIVAAVLIDHDHIAIFTVGDVIRSLGQSVEDGLCVGSIPFVHV